VSPPNNGRRNVDGDDGDGDDGGNRWSGRDM